MTPLPNDKKSKEYDLLTKSNTIWYADCCLPLYFYNRKFKNHNSYKPNIFTYKYVISNNFNKMQSVTNLRLGDKKVRSIRLRPDTKRNANVLWLLSTF